MNLQPQPEITSEKQVPCVSLLFDKSNVAGKTFVLPQHVTDKKSE
jgi:hypothetical protein